MWIRQIYGFFLRWQGFYPISLLTCVPLSRLVLQPKTTHALFLPPPPCRAYSSNVVAPGIACVILVSASDGGWVGISASPRRSEWAARWGAFPRSTRECGVVVFLHGGLRRWKGRLLTIFLYNYLNINVYRLNIVNPVIGHLVINDFGLSGGRKSSIIYKIYINIYFIYYRGPPPCFSLMT